MALFSAVLIGMVFYFTSAEHETPPDPAKDAKIKLGMKAFYENVAAHEQSWIVTKDEDRMGRQRTVAVVHSLHPIIEQTNEWPKSEELAVRSTSGEPIDVIVRIPSELSFACDDECFINVRLDNGPIERYSVVHPTDHSDSTFFFKNATSFLPRLKRAKTAKIEASIYNRGTRVMEFNVAGLDLNKP